MWNCDKKNCVFSLRQLAVTQLSIVLHFGTDQSLLKRGLTPQEMDNVAKKSKPDLCKFYWLFFFSTQKDSNPSSCCILLSLTFSSFSVAPQKVVIRVENGMVKRKCPNCQEEILTEEALKYHMMVSKTLVKNMLLSNGIIWNNYIK